MVKVFISYGREDRELADKLAKGLKGLGHEVWWDRDLKGGAHFRGVIEEEIRNAQAMIVIWTRTSVKKDFVLDEAERAKKNGRLIPVSFDLDPDLPLGFGQLNYVDLSLWKGAVKDKQLAELDRAIKSVGEGRYVEAISTLTGRSVATKGTSNEAMRAVMELGSTVGGLPVQRYLGGVAAAAGLAAVVQAMGEAVAQGGEGIPAILALAFQAALAAAIARACAQFILLAKGGSSRTFFDSKFSFWSLLAVLLTAIVFAVFMNSGMEWDVLAGQSVVFAFGAIASLFVLRSLLALANILMSRV